MFNNLICWSLFKLKFWMDKECWIEWRFGLFLLLIFGVFFKFFFWLIYLIDEVRVSKFFWFFFLKEVNMFWILLGVVGEVVKLNISIVVFCFWGWYIFFFKYFRCNFVCKLLIFYFFICYNVRWGCWKFFFCNMSVE